MYVTENVTYLGYNITETETPDHGLLIAMETLIVITMAVGIPGNLVVIMVILMHTKLQNAGGVLILSLSTSDIMYFSIILPIRFITFHSKRWLWGDIMCQFVGGFAHCCLGASISLMSAIAFSRYLHVLHPTLYKKLFGKKGLAIQLSFLWTAILLFTTILPMFGVLGHYAFLETILSCTYDPEGDLIYKYVSLSCSLAVPIGFTTICYGLIYCKVKTTHKNMQKWTTSTPRIQPGNEPSVSITMNETTNDLSQASSPRTNNGSSVYTLDKVNEESFTTAAMSRIITMEPEVSVQPPATYSTKPQNLQPILKPPNLKRLPKRLKNVSISLDKNVITNYRQRSFFNSDKKTKPSRWRRDSFKMTFMMATAFGVFITTLAPYAVLSLVDSKQENASGYLLTLALSWFNGCINPIIYVAMNTQYRRAVLHVFRCRCRSNRVSDDSQLG